MLIRPRGGRCAADRLTALLHKDVFRSLGEHLGTDGLAQVVNERVTVIEGDLGSVGLPTDLDVVIHGTSTVSFDPLWTRPSVPTPRAWQPSTKRSPPPAAHVVHVSTTYVAGTH